MSSSQLVVLLDDVVVLVVEVDVVVVDVLDVAVW